MDDDYIQEERECRRSMARQCRSTATNCSSFLTVTIKHISVWLTLSKEWLAINQQHPADTRCSHKCQMATTLLSPLRSLSASRPKQVQTGETVFGLTTKAHSDSHILLQSILHSCTWFNSDLGKLVWPCTSVWRESRRWLYWYGINTAIYQNTGIPPSKTKNQIQTIETVLDTYTKSKVQ